MELTNTRTGEAVKVMKYAPPKKFTAVKALVNGVEQDARYTNSRGKDYTYFNVGGFSLYAAGKLEEGTDHTIALPEDFKGPSWDADRPSTYVPKRKPKSADAGADGAADSAEGSADAGAEPAESATASADSSSEGSEGIVAPRQRRKRGE